MVRNGVERCFRDGMLLGHFCVGDHRVRPLVLVRAADSGAEERKDIIFYFIASALIPGRHRGKPRLRDGFAGIWIVQVVAQVVNRGLFMRVQKR